MYITYKYFNIDIYTWILVLLRKLKLSTRRFFAGSYIRCDRFECRNRESEKYS